MGTGESLIEVMPPGAEPVTLTDMKAFLRLGETEDDAGLSEMIATARQYCEQWTGRAFVARTYALFLDALDEARIIFLPYPPLIRVDHISLYAENDIPQVVPASDYHVDVAGGRISLMQGKGLYVSSLRAAGGVEIQYRAGYGTAPSAVPQSVRHAIKQLVTRLYQHRGDDPESVLSASGALALLQPYRVMQL